MRISIITDMEGVAGIMNFKDWCKPDGIYYEKGCRLLTEEVNACVQGLFEGGATEIIVSDDHAGSNPGNIDPELLDERVLLKRGHARETYPSACLHEGSNALVFVGQHAKAGTDYSHISHTMGWAMIDLTLNDISIGEYGIHALVAMELNIPTILATGEEALVKEAETLTPGVVGIAVKRGLRTDGLDDLTAEQYSRAKLGAVHISPKSSRAKIKNGACMAMEKLNKTPELFTYPELKPPYKLVLKSRRTEKTPIKTEVREHPTSITGLFNLKSI